MEGGREGGRREGGREGGSEGGREEWEREGGRDTCIHSATTCTCGLHSCQLGQPITILTITIIPAEVPHFNPQRTISHEDQPSIM